MKWLKRLTKVSLRYRHKAHRGGRGRRGEVRGGRGRGKRGEGRGEEESLNKPV